MAEEEDCVCYEQRPRPIIDSFVQEDGDKEIWVRWRKMHLHDYIFSSDLANFCGVGYISIPRALKYKLGVEEPPEPTGFSQVLMNHGVEYETAAIRRVLPTLDKMGYVLHGHQDPELKIGLPSYVYEMRKKDKIYALLGCTMDCILADRGDEYGTKYPLEIKCPAYWKMSGYSPEEARQEFRLKWDHGKPNYFIQAACYALVQRAKTFFVYVHFTDGQQSTGLLYQYTLGRQTRRLLKAVMKDINKQKAPGRPKDFKYAKSLTMECIKRDLVNTHIVFLAEDCYNGSKEIN